MSKFFGTRNFLKPRRFLRRFFWYCETTKFRKEIVILHSSSSFLSIMFSMPKVFWNTECFPYEFKRHCETKNFRRKIVILSPLPQLAIKSFDARNFLEHRRVPLRNFLVLWDNSFSTENRDTHPPMKFRVTVGQYNIDRKSWCPLALLSLTAFGSGKVPLRNVLVLWDKKLWTEIRGTHSPDLLFIKFFDTGTFLEHSTEGFLYEMFWYCETTNFWRKNVILTPPLRNFSVLWDNTISTENRDTCTIPYPQFFRYHKLYETLYVCATKLLGTVRQNVFDGNSWYSFPPTCYSWSFSTPEQFWNAAQRRFLYESFWYCQTTAFRPKIVILTPPPLRSFSVLWDKTI